MRIAVTCENDQVFQHFGHTPGFAVFEVSGLTIVKESRLSSGESIVSAVCRDLLQLFDPAVPRS